MEISDLKLAAIVAAATIFGGGLERGLSSLVADANTSATVEAEMVSLAIGLLSETPETPHAANSAEAVLRNWAFEILNSSAKVAMPEEGRVAIVTGVTSFGITNGDKEALLRLQARESAYDQALRGAENATPEQRQRLDDLMDSIANGETSN
ncbi:MAG: hypothetical protein ABJL99_09955 [Aliishimia sp.]